MKSPKKKNINKKKAVLFRKGNKYMKSGDWMRASLAYMDLWEIDEKDEKNLILLSNALVKIGAREKALDLLGKALEANGPRLEILQIMGTMANTMDMHDIAEKIYLQYMSLYKDNAEGILGYCHSLGGQDRFSESIDFLQQTIPQFPDVPELWNILGSHLFKIGRITDSVTFFKESLKLSGDHYAIYNNLAMAAEYLWEFDLAMEYGEKALEFDPTSPEPRMGKAMRLLRMGKLEEGWECYEARHDPRKGDNIIYTQDLPIWKGEDLKGKTILLRSEQGLGDEILFTHFYKPIFDMAEKVIIGCEKRLQPLLERTFPDADVYFHGSAKKLGYYYRGYPALDQKINDGEQQIDFAITIGSVCQYLYKKGEQVLPSNDGLIIPDPKRVSFWRNKFSKLGEGKKIGLSWKSGITGKGRDIFYFNLDDFSPALKVENAIYISMQYTNCAEEIKSAEEKYGIKIHTFDEIDLRNDLDDFAAYAKALDLAIGPYNSSPMFALSVGTPVWWISRGSPWWFLGCGDHPPFFTKSRNYPILLENPWDDLMLKTAKRLEQFIKTGDPLQD